MLFSAEELNQVLGSFAHTGVSGVAIDSRFVKQGELFFALRGENQDGHCFVPDAIAAGARLAVVERPMENMEDRCLVVKDSYKALCKLACYARARCRGVVIGITGSVGKTGIKEALKSVLSASGHVHASEKNFNNRWGVPLTLANLPKDAAYGLIEMGTNHHGEIRDLSTLTQPDGGILTCIGVGHTEFLGSLSGVAQEKMGIFQGIKSQGWAVFPADSPYFQVMQETAQAHKTRLITFGMHPEATVRLCDWSLGAKTSSVEVQIAGHRHRYTIPVPGEHWVLNSTCLLAVGQALSIPPENIYGRLQTFSLPEGRGKSYQVRLPGGREILLLDESYNANPVSMRAALMLLGLHMPINEERRIAVLGDMGELGDESDRFHENLAPTIGKNTIDRIFCCGTLMQRLYTLLPEHRRGMWGACSKDLCAPLLEELKTGDVVLIKGSASMHMKEIVQFLMHVEDR
ncbi:MAG: UDP-N-acetylmuramoyl-tripeptide--D-alanyl-D-alanine ligase [Holosporales bacterium]|jgi:UDP-N-acetylmuramoyl-tripeptide--D-alanyl-D-alanine ligase|nr:UDP-N-acetylmuramoyl-tripeptide--D-alanyl-D-alanine ligase [Holosporales bacterium]